MSSHFIGKGFRTSLGTVIRRTFNTIIRTQYRRGGTNTTSLLIIMLWNPRTMKVQVISLLINHGVLYNFYYSHRSLTGQEINLILFLVED